jgi:TRAP-type transport system small permease protein
MLGKIEKALSRVDMVAIWVCGISLAVMVIYSFIDVMGRFLFHRPLYGTYELSGEILIVVVVFLSLSPCEGEKRHMRVDFIFPYISQKAIVMINCITYACGIVVCGLLLATCIGPAWDSWKIREFTAGIIEFPIYTARFAIVAGLALFVMRLLVRLAGSIRDFSRDLIHPKTIGPDISHASDQI